MSILEDRMNDRIAKLRAESFEAQPSISIERALLETAFYKENSGKHSLPVLRAMCFRHLCSHKTIYIGEGELLVGERGPRPKAVSTFPELTCHSATDLRILNSRSMASYRVAEEDIRRYEEEVIPYWQGRSMRDRIFSNIPDEWRIAYEAGLFTEFMEQRAPGHTALDGTIYNMGMVDFQAKIADRLARLDFQNDPTASDKAEQLRAMSIACEAAMIFARRHAELAEAQAETGTRPAAPCRTLYHCRNLSARPGRKTTHPARGPADVLVRPPRHHYRIEWLGCHDPRSPRPAPAALLRKGSGRRQSLTGKRPRN